MQETSLHIVIVSLANFFPIAYLILVVGDVFVFVVENLPVSLYIYQDE